MRTEDQPALQIGCALRGIDKDLIISHILIPLLSSTKYNLWNFMYKILIHALIEFVVSQGLIAPACSGWHQKGSLTNLPMEWA